MGHKLSKRLIVCLCVVFAIIIGVVILWHTGFLVFDHSAVIGMEGMSWNGKDYSVTAGEYTEGKTIAKDKQGLKIKEVKEDPSHTFVVVRSFLDQELYVRDDYQIPRSGKVTKVCWADKYINDKKLINALATIDSQKTTSFDYVPTDEIFVLNDNQHMKPLYFAYEDCPIATVNKGWLGKINGEFVMTTYVDDTVGCYSVPDEYLPILEKYFSEK